MVEKSKQEIAHFIKISISQIIDLNIKDIDEKTEFFALGLSSVTALFVIQELEKFLDEEINPLVFWNYPSIESVSGYLSKSDR